MAEEVHEAAVDTEEDVGCDAKEKNAHFARSGSASRSINPHSIRCSPVRRLQRRPLRRATKIPPRTPSLSLPASQMCDPCVSYG